MRRASSQPDHCLLGILNANEQLISAYTVEEFKQLLNNHPDSILFFNQSPLAREINNSVVHVDGQQHIEVFQETKGVFGLRAYLQIGKVETPVTLELSD